MYIYSTLLQVKGKGGRFVQRPVVRNSGMDHTVFTLQTHHTCLHLVSVHQTAPPPLTVIAAIRLQLTAHLWIPRGRKAELD